MWKAECDKLHGRRNKDVMLAGVRDDNINKEVFNTGIFSRSSYEIISLAECQEMGLHVTENVRTVSEVSPFQRQKQDAPM